jgi:DNA modification methylase
MEIDLWPVDRPKPYPGNPRQNDAAVGKVAESLRRFGFRQPIVVDADGVVIVGHTRLRAAKEAGIDMVPVHVASGMTPDEVAAYRLADNKTAEFAEWDLGQLNIELDSIDMDMSWLEFDLEAEEVEGQTDEDSIPVVAEDPTSERGKVYSLGLHRLMCGDSTRPESYDALLDEPADMMFTDPPYGVDYKGGHFHSGDVNVVREREALASDEDASIYAEFLPVALSAVDGPCYMWFADTKAHDVYGSVIDNGCVISSLLIWHKTNATYAAMNAQYKQRHEPCLYFKPKGATLRWSGPTNECTVWEIKRDAQNKFHPTQKPVELAERAIGNHDAQTVLDCFAGSGSTIIAAEKTGRICYGIELSEKYCDVIRKRWAEFVHGEGCDWQALTPEAE